METRRRVWVNNRAKTQKQRRKKAINLLSGNNSATEIFSVFNVYDVELSWLWLRLFFSPPGKATSILMFFCLLECQLVMVWRRFLDFLLCFCIFFCLPLRGAAINDSAVLRVLHRAGINEFFGQVASHCHPRLELHTESDSHSQMQFFAVNSGPRKRMKYDTEQRK